MQEPVAQVAPASPCLALVASCRMVNFRRTWQRSFAISVTSLVTLPGTVLSNKKGKGKGGEVAAACGARPEDDMSDGDFQSL
jgi:uncharacterized protein YcfJ